MVLNIDIPVCRGHKTTKSFDFDFDLILFGQLFLFRENSEPCQHTKFCHRNEGFNKG